MEKALRHLRFPALMLFLLAAEPVVAKPVLWLCEPKQNTERTAITP